MYARYTCIYIIYTIHPKCALHTPYIHHTVGTDQVVDPWARSVPYPPTCAGRRIAWNDLGEDTGQGRTITGSIRARTMTFRTRRREGAWNHYNIILTSTTFIHLYTPCIHTRYTCIYYITYTVHTWIRLYTPPLIHPTIHTLLYTLNQRIN